MMDPMIRLESGGNPAAVNRRTGATGLRQFMPSALQAAGVYQPGGADGWAGVFRIPGHEGVQSRQDFMANPAAQEAVYRLHQENLRREIARRGLAASFGQTVGGAVLDEDAAMRGMHFAGPGGFTRFVRSGGQYDPSDGNLRLSQYLGRTAGQPRTGPPPSAPSAPAPAPEMSAPAAPMALKPPPAEEAGIDWRQLLAGALLGFRGLG